MKHRFVVPVLIVFMAALCAPPVFAQLTGNVKGVCKDLEGKPIAGAIVEYANVDTGRKYDLKTNTKGEYFSLGIEPGTYRVVLLQDGKEVFHFNGFHVAVDENILDFDLKKEMYGTAQGLTPEQKQKQEEAAKAAKESNVVKALNEKLLAAKQASDAGDFDTAISVMTQATQMDANRDLLWAKLGEAYLSSASKQTDSAEKAKRFAEAASDYQKAIDLKQKAVAAGTDKSPDANAKLAQYSNNLAQALGKSGKTDDAIKAYTQAAQLDPTSAGLYYFNLGATLTNSGKTDEAVAAYDKAIAADPTKADAYYQKGVCLVGKATTDKDGKVTPVPGTTEAFNKYLELQPNGPNAEAARSMLQYIGSTVETSFGTTKKKTTKK